MRHCLCVSMPYGPFFGDTDFPLRAARPSSGEQPGALRSRAGTWSETGRKPFSFFTLNTAASGVHTKKETSSSPESRKLSKLTAWGPPHNSNNFSLCISSHALVICPSIFPLATSWHISHHHRSLVVEYCHLTSAILESYHSHWQQGTWFSNNIAYHQPWCSHHWACQTCQYLHH